MKIISQLTVVEQWLDHVYIIIVVSMNYEYLKKKSTQSIFEQFTFTMFNPHYLLVRQGLPLKKLICLNRAETCVKS